MVGGQEFCLISRKNRRNKVKEKCSEQRGNWIIKFTSRILNMYKNILKFLQGWAGICIWVFPI
jgi:hypothetical protein